MDLEFHQLDLRYERLRARQPARERRLLASLADAGQQMPIVVVIGGAAYVVVDGHKRVRCLRQLHRDTVAAVMWEISEADALIFRQLLHTEATASALEQGWLLRALHEDHGLALDALARRFHRSVSWVSRRVSLVRTLPEVVQQHVHDGRLVAHAAMKYFVPLARANVADCRLNPTAGQSTLANVQRMEAIAAFGFTERQARFLLNVLLHSGHRRSHLRPRNCQTAGGAAGAVKPGVPATRGLRGGVEVRSPSGTERSEVA
jgi:ParB/RepB/Spo0J family partition protein